MTDEQKCLICGNPHLFSWTDTWGVAQCHYCGVPYRILHSSRRDVRSSTILVRDSCIEHVKRYWDEEHRRMPSHYSVPGGQELATAEDVHKFTSWWLANVPTEDVDIRGEVQP